ncbi:MAG: glycosyltransferase family 4 protein [Deltaproteobacteria bacterium]
MSPRVFVLSPGFPLEGDKFGAAVAEQILALGRRFDLRVCSLVPLAERRARRGDVEVLGPPDVGRLGRFRAIAEAADVWRPDLFWCLWVDRAGPPAIALSKMFDRPVVASVMGGELARLPHVAYGTRRSLRGRVTVQAVLRAARVVTVGSPRLREQAEAIAGATVRETPFGVDPARIQPRTRAPWTKDRPLKMAAVVDVARVKGSEMIFAAHAELLRQGVEARLTVFSLTPKEGHAELRGRASAAGIGEHVVWSPPLAAEGLYRRLPDFDVHVSASLHESQGLALIEAAMANVPVVAPHVGVAEVLAGQGAATLVKSTSAPELAHAILQAASAPVSGRERVAAVYGIEPCTERFAAAIEEALS